MLLECLKCTYHIQVVNCQADAWFWEINPLRMVPAIQDKVSPDGSRPSVFESGACLQYIASKYDVEGKFGGRNEWEEAQVLSWLAMHDANLG